MSNKNEILYDLKTGYPHMGVIRRDVLRDITARMYEKDAALQYSGVGNGPAPVMEQIANMLSKQTGQTVPSDELHLTVGAIFGVDAACRFLSKPGDIALVESPTFYYITKKFELSNVEVMGVPLQRDGVDLNALEDICKKYGDRISLFYVIPSFHNPTGYCYSEEKRRALIGLAQKYNFAIIEDTIYQTIYYDAPPAPMIREFDDGSGHVINVGSFSKLVMPAIRTGWIWSTAKQTHDLRAVNTSVNSALMAFLAAEMIETGEMNKQFDHARAFYGGKYRLMVDALEEFAPDWLQWEKPEGGYFIWCTLPDGLTTTDVLAAANQQGVDFMNGHLAFVGENAPDRHMRLCFALQEDDVVVKGVEVLCQVLKAIRIKA